MNNRAQLNIPNRRNRLNLPPMAARRLIRLGVLGALTSTNMANSYGWTIETPGDTPTDAVHQLPNIMIRIVHGSKQQQAKGQHNFTTSILCEIEGKIQATTQQAAQDAIEAMEYQIENAVLADYGLGLVIQEAAPETINQVMSDGKMHTGALKTSIRFEVYEQFDITRTPEPPYSPWPIAWPGLSTEEFSLRVFGDLTNVFDPNGVYSNVEFPGTGAPRTTGPDGRNEFILDLPMGHMIADDCNELIRDSEGEPILDSSTPDT